MQRETIDWALMAQVKRAESFIVARPHTAQQVLVSEFGPVRHALFDVSAAPYDMHSRGVGEKFQKIDLNQMNTSADKLLRRSNLDHAGWRFVL
jgi:hypothetical protein